MASTANYGWIKPTVGGDNDAWGGELNTDLDGIDSTVKSVSNAIPAASSTTPVMDGTAAVGTGTTWARADHVHPSDTTRLAKTGVTDGSDAPAGQIGEVISSVVTTGVTLTTATPANVASISLTAGDWDVSGEVWGSIPSGATGFIAAISTTSASFPGTVALNTSRLQMNATLNPSTITAQLRTCRVSLAAPATYYLVTQITFSAGTVAATGAIWARRAR